MNGLRTSPDELFVRWQQDGDERARDQLVQFHLPLATRLARRYHGTHEPFDDLQQVATVGLLKAIDRYDPSRSTGFRAFAVPTIVGELKRYFRDCSWSVHMPRGIQDLALKVERAQRTLTAANGRAPTIHHLAEYLELSVEEVLDAAEATTAHHAVSLDSAHENSDGEIGTLGEAIGDLDEGFDRVDCGTAIMQAAEGLPERERRVLALRFLADQTQMEIADQIGVSQMQVSRILRRTVDELSLMVDGELD
jgi:RNA polymerase sigma-B factor